MNNLFSTDSEIAVLSIILNNPDLAFDTNGLKFFMFSALGNQLIFAEMEELLSKNLVPDPSLIIMSLEAKGNLSKCGGKGYLESIYKQVYPKENLHEYISIIVASYKARSLMSTISAIKADDITLDNVDQRIQNFKSAIDHLTENTVIGQTIHIGDGMKEAFDEFVARTKNPGIRGTPWGFKKVDILTGGKSPGELVIIAGRPSMGKTAVVCNSLLSDGRNKIPSILFSREMNYLSLLERLVAIECGVPISNIRLGVLNQVQLDAVRDSLKRIKEMPIYIDTNFLMDTYTIEATTKKFVSVHGIKVLYLDYIQLLAERNENMVHELGKISRMCKLLAEGLNISITILSQLNREVEHRDNKRPILSDLKQSGSLEEDADIVVGLYRDECYNSETKYAGLMEFNILKNRNGPVGNITLGFKSETNQITGE